MLRIVGIWVFGSIASLLIGGVVGASIIHATDYNGKAFGFIFGGIGTLAAFICFRLWRGEVL